MLPTPRMPPPTDQPVDLSAAADPVGSFRSAAAAGRSVRLATSGSGQGVIRTTTSWVSSFGPVSRLAGIGPASKVWVPGPLSASMNVFARVHASYAGATIVDAASKATHAVLTPAQLDTLLDTGAPGGLTVVVAGDRLSVGLHDRAVGQGLAVHHYYGAAELSFVAWGAHEADLRPFPGVEVEIRDLEIWVRSPFLCAEPPRRSPDGFATVGDRGRLVGGRLVVDGRPGAITTGGATVLVADVERVLRSVARGQVAVTAVPHVRLGAVVAAVLTDPEDRARMESAARSELPPAARPRLWRTLPVLPLTAAGKLDRDAVARFVDGPGAH